MPNPAVPISNPIEQTAAPFYHALGRAIAHWQNVEAGLFVLAHAILGADYRYSSLVFFHIQSADSKLQLIDRLCREKFSPQIVEREWKPLYRDLITGKNFRNSLAHFEANWVFDLSQFRPGDPPIVLAPHHLDTTRIKNETVKGATTADLANAASEYTDFSRRLFYFVCRHFPLETLRATHLPLQLMQSLEKFQIDPPATTPQPQSSPALSRQARRKAERERRKHQGN